MKTAREIRTMMRDGRATIGTWLQFPSADVAEVMGASGYDWVAADMEHGAFTRAVLPDVFRAIERNCAPSRTRWTPARRGSSSP